MGKPATALVVALTLAACKSEPGDESTGSGSSATTTSTAAATLETAAAVHCPHPLQDSPPCM